MLQLSGPIINSVDFFNLLLKSIEAIMGAYVIVDMHEKKAHVITAFASAGNISPSPCILAMCMLPGIISNDK